MKTVFISRFASPAILFSAACEKERHSFTNPWKEVRNPTVFKRSGEPSDEKFARYITLRDYHFASRNNKISGHE